MPNRALIAADNFASCCQWIKQNLNTGFMTATCNEVTKVPKKKGIYFWFMPKTAYTALSKYVSVSQMDKVCEMEIEGVLYDLVYLGTAGTGKSGSSNLYERLKWHLCTKHTKSAVCSGTLSTLRAGLGALLADDLIEPNTEAEVNDFMCKYMKVYWIAYGDNDKDAIDDDESKLIEKLRPLLNIKNNPNAAVTGNATYIYKQRRTLVYDFTRNRIKCISDDIVAQKNISKQEITTPRYSHQIVSDNDCIKFTVSDNQSIASVIKEIPNLPTGPCRVLVLVYCYLQSPFPLLDRKLRIILS